MVLSVVHCGRNRRGTGRSIAFLVITWDLSCDGNAFFDAQRPITYNPVDSIASTRRLALLLSLGSGMAFAQSTLPSTTPTTLPAPTLTGTSPIDATRPGRLANVSYVQGQLEITADNSSLNQILREISRLTGMTITGGVADQRVFGKYGPAAPSDILTNLLQGTGSNMLLLNSASNTPSQLILTPQRGGPTLPNPNAPGLDADTSAAPTPPPYDPPVGQQSRPVYSPGQALVRPRFGAAPPQNLSAVAPGAPVDPVPNAPPQDNPTSLNGVQTPQQVYQQLQRLQSAQPQH